MFLGVHCSIRKSLLNALDEAKTLKCNTIQIFTCNPRRWNHRKYTKDEISEFNKRRVTDGINPLIVHIFYLPNLATSDENLYKKSVNLLIEDLQVSAEIKANYFIVHLGAYSIESSKEYGIERISCALNYATSKTSNKITILLENVSGGGRRIGSTFEELKAIINKIKDKKCIGICLDTAHLIASGYPFSSKKEVDNTIKELHKIIGIKYLKVIHLNDSHYPFNSKKDRHQHIGKGYIGIEGFRAILHHTYLKNLPFILETPKSSKNADKRNLNTVLKLSKP